MLSPMQQCWVMAGMASWLCTGVLWCGVGWVDDPRDAQVERSSPGCGSEWKEREATVLCPEYDLFQTTGAWSKRYSNFVTLWCDISHVVSQCSRHLQDPQAPCWEERAMGREGSAPAESPGASGGWAFRGECPAFPAVRTSGQGVPPVSPGQICAHLG